MKLIPLNLCMYEVHTQLTWQRHMQWYYDTLENFKKLLPRNVYYSTPQKYVASKSIIILEKWAGLSLQLKCLHGNHLELNFHEFWRTLNT